MNKIKGLSVLLFLSSLIAISNSPLKAMQGEGRNRFRRAPQQRTKSPDIAEQMKRIREARERELRPAMEQEFSQFSLQGPMAKFISQEELEREQIRMGEDADFGLMLYQEELERTSISDAARITAEIEELTKKQTQLTNYLSKLQQQTAQAQQALAQAQQSSIEELKKQALQKKEDETAAEFEEKAAEADKKAQDTLNELREARNTLAAETAKAQAEVQVHQVKAQQIVTKLAETQGANKAVKAATAKLGDTLKAPQAKQLLTH